MRVGCGFLIQQTVPAGEPMLAQSSLEICDLGPISMQIVCRRQQLQPNRVEFQSPHTEHPLQWHGKNATSLAIFRGKSASDKDRHARRIAVRVNRSSTETVCSHCAFGSKREIKSSNAITTTARTPQKM